MTNSSVLINDLSDAACAAQSEMQQYRPGSIEHDEARRIARKSSRALFYARTMAEPLSAHLGRAIARDRASVMNRVEYAAAQGGARLGYQDYDLVRSGGGSHLVRQWLGEDATAAYEAIPSQHESHYGPDGRLARAISEYQASSSR